MKTELNWFYVAISCVVLAGCAGAPKNSVQCTTENPGDFGRNPVLAMQCDGLDFVAELREDGAYIFLPDFSGLLPRVPSDSGMAYQAENIRLHTDGDRGRLEYGGRVYDSCQNDRRAAIVEQAKLNGVDFRAVGNEPGWLMEISDTTVMLLSDFGAERCTYSGATSTTDPGAGRTVYSAGFGEHSIQVLLENRPCNDVMSGEPFPATVTVTRFQDTLHGCGQALH